MDIRSLLYLDVDELPVKLTSSNMQTRNGCQWALNETKIIDKCWKYEYNHLCSPGFFHYYRHPLFAYLYNSVHASFGKPRMFHCVPSGRIIHEYNKSGSTELTITKEIIIDKTVIDVLFGCQAIRHIVRDRVTTYFQKVQRYSRLNREYDMFQEYYSIDSVFNYGNMSLPLLKKFVEICIEEGRLNHLQDAINKT